MRIENLEQCKLHPFYHATIERSLSAIKREGLRPPIGVNSARWFMLTDNLQGAQHYATGDTPVIIRYVIPANEIKQYLWDGIRSDYYGVQYGLRQPLPSKYIISIYPVPLSTLTTRR